MTTPTDDDFLHMAWEMTEGASSGSRFNTANSDINVVYYARKILPLCKKMYELGFLDGAQHAMESKVTQFLDGKHG